MGIFQQKTPLEKELDALNKREKKFLTSRQEKEDTALNQFLADKVPPTLQDTLDTAFYKAFQVIFEKGTGVIEKTYQKEKKEKKKRKQIDLILQKRPRLSPRPSLTERPKLNLPPKLTGNNVPCHTSVYPVRFKDPFVLMQYKVWEQIQFILPLIFYVMEKLDSEVFLWILK